ncbi:MAG TPA: type II secretion system inner membrane protein GspF [Steroidobacteraceae bacterium]|jgi:general secretion pathway protein F|nr:type II secretion system inner membrane protein GspF [Steroidobacteraceae bacterium]
MGAFEYTAVDTTGRERKGVLEGDTARQVRQLLREQKLLPVSVAEVVQTESKRQRSFGLGLVSGVSSTDLALLTRQLATLVRSGLPLEESLLAVSQQTEKPRIKSILLGVRSRVMEGHTLADGFAEFPQVFPEIYRATVAAGEQSGRLDAVLERLADYTENRQVIRQKISNALVYPIALTVMCFSIVSVLLVFVVPKVVKVFETSKRELPIATRILIGSSHLFREYGIYILIVLVIAGWLVVRHLRREGPKRQFHRFLLRVPLIGRLVRGVNTARFTRTFSILTASAVPVLESLRISSEVITNVPMREAVSEASDRIREGSPIGKSLGASRLFPPMTIHLISSGETSGELEAMLDRAATNQERELDGLIGTMLGLMGPVLIVFMGLLVMGIVFALLLPIFQLNDLVQ